MKLEELRCDHGTCNTKLGEITEDGKILIKYKGLQVQQHLPGGFVVITCPKCGWSRILDMREQKHIQVTQPSSQDYYETEPTFPCPYCDFSAKSLAGLSSHIRYRHPDALEI